MVVYFSCAEQSSAMGEYIWHPELVPVFTAIYKQCVIGLSAVL